MFNCCKRVNKHSFQTNGFGAELELSVWFCASKHVSKDIGRISQRRSTCLFFFFFEGVGLMGWQWGSAGDGLGWEEDVALTSSASVKPQNAYSDALLL